MGRTIALASVIKSRPNEIEQMACFRRDAAIVVGANRDPSTPRSDAFKVYRHVCPRLWDALRLCFGGLGLFRRGVCLFGDAYFVALRREWILNIFAQSQRVNVRVAIRSVVEFNVGNLRREFAIADEVEIVALWVPCRIECIKGSFSHTADLIVGGAPHVNLRKSVAGC